MVHFPLHTSHNQGALSRCSQGVGCPLPLHPLLCSDPSVPSF